MREPPKSFNAELWPHRNQTERHHRARVQQYYQSREAEHPHKYFEQLEKRLNTLSPQIVGSAMDVPIAPPQNSDSRIMRDGYFS